MHFLTGCINSYYYYDLMNIVLSVFNNDGVKFIFMIYYSYNFQMDLPVEPEPGDCCNSGCTPCILDVYAEQLKKYEKLKNQKNRTDTFLNCINPTSYSQFKLTKVEQHSPSTFLYTFTFLKLLHKNAAPTEHSSFKLIYAAAQHFLIKAELEDHRQFTRAYTPLLFDEEHPTEFTILIKFYEHGLMSQQLKKMSVGDVSLWRGPYGDFQLNTSCKFILFVVQGTGIAPVYGLLNDVLQNENCFSVIKLLFCASCCDEILLRDKLQEFSRYWNFSYEVYLSAFHNFNCKYKEVVYKKKLSVGDLEVFLADKLDNINCIVCGSDSFSESMKNCILKCNVSSQNIFVL